MQITANLGEREELKVKTEGFLKCSPDIRASQGQTGEVQHGHGCPSADEEEKWDQLEVSDRNLH